MVYSLKKRLSRLGYEVGQENLLSNELKGGFHLTSSGLGIWLYYYAKHQPQFAILLCTKMAVLSRD